MTETQIKDLLKLLDKKNDFISNRIDNLQAMVNKAAKVLSGGVIRNFSDSLEIDEGKIKPTQSNLRRLNLIDKAWREFQDLQGVKLLTTFVADIKDLFTLGAEYYVEMIPDRIHTDKIGKIIDKQMGVVWKGKSFDVEPNGYVSLLQNDNSVLAEIKQTAARSVLAKEGPATLNKNLQNLIVGPGERSGAVDNYWRRFAYDTYSEVDRTNSMLHAEELDLKYFLYNGGIIRDSREFCKDHAGKCYSTAEAAKWKDLIGKYRTVNGRKKPIGPIVAKGEESTYNPLTDAGGIACRHSNDFVSDSIAMLLRGGKK